MKKRTTKIAAALFAATLAVTGTGLGDITANAQSIQINEQAADHVYQIYQLFTGTVTGNTLSGIQAGSGLTVDATLVSNLKKAFPSNTAIQALDSGASAEAVAQAIGTIKGENQKVLTDDQKALVQALRASLTTTVYGTAQYDKTAKNYTATINDDGYYLIMDAEGKGSVVSGDSATAYLLRVVDASSESTLVIDPKSSVPTVEKKVWNNTETAGTWEDAADYQVGDSISYKLTGTVASDYANYTEYFFKFTDTLSSGLDYTADSAKVGVDANKNGKIDKGEEIGNALYEFDYTAEEKDSVKTGRHILTVTFDDLKEVSTVAADSKIIVEYTATLNDSAVKNLEKDGEGNPNEVVLTYSNNPNYTGEGENSPKDTTPEDVVTVFTFTVDATKLQPTTATETKALEGAIFTMSDSTGVIAYGISNANGKITFYKTSTVDVTNVANGVLGTTDGVEVTLDQAGTYTLKEIFAPANFSKVSDITFKVDATYEYSDVADPKIKALTITNVDGTAFSQADVTATAATNKDAANFAIIDRPTSNLPITGDAGRALYYAFGGMVAIAALLYLLREKKNA